MKNISRINDINYKTNTGLIIDYLETVITDEMILNSFIRDLKIIDEDKKYIYMSINSREAIAIIKENYITYFNDAVKNIYKNSLEIKFILNGEKILKNIKNSGISEDISKKFTLSNYVIGKFNEEPVSMCKRTVKELGVFSPIFITSPSGFGKTHLLHAIGNEYVNNGYSVKYIEPNKLTKMIIEKSKSGGSGVSDYIDELNKFDILLFDDIQNLGDRSVTLKVLFQIINTFFEGDKQVIITSDKHPNELTGFESRFITRFNSGLTTSINNPSTDDLIKVIEFKLGEQNLSPNKWETEALKFIARNNSSSIRSIEGAVKRIKYYTADESNIKYTYAVIQNIFKELSIDPAELTPNRIINTVANYYKISKSELLGKSRKHNIMVARHMAIWLVRKMINIPFKEIGDIFGGRDHSTIIASIKKIDANMQINDIVKVAAKRIEEKIKSIY